MLVTLTITADNDVKLYLNGVLIDDGGRNHDEWVTLKFYAQVGDVIGMRAQDSFQKYGLMADIEFMGQHIVTTIGGTAWRVKERFQGEFGEEWATQAFDACAWTHPVASTLTAGVDGAVDFPTGNGAEYVWAAGAGEFSTIYARTVLGGETC